MPGSRLRTASPELHAVRGRQADHSPECHRMYGHLADHKKVGWYSKQISGQNNCNKQTIQIEFRD